MCLCLMLLACRVWTWQWVVAMMLEVVEVQHLLELLHIHSM